MDIVTGDFECNCRTMFIVLAHTKRGAKKTEKRFITLASEVGFSVINAETFVEQKDGFVAVTVVYALSRSDRS